MSPEKERFLEVYASNLCNITETCKKAQIKARQTFYNWLKDDPEFAEKAREVEESMIDFVESQQMLMIRGVPKYRDRVVNGQVIKEFAGWTERPNERLIQFFLTTKGKHRGYVKKTELVISTPEHEELMKLKDEELNDRILEYIKAEQIGEAPTS